ncbi:PREDICTED: ADIPOR-like receptor IZH1-like isoform 2 [Fragaria vesca subsp. vesca]
MCNHGKSSSGKQQQQKKSGNYKKEKKKTTMLVKFQDLPQYMKDNEYILDYYRCEWPLKDVIFSVFAWHNETLNIWTDGVSGPLMMMSMMMKMNQLNVSDSVFAPNSHLKEMSQSSFIHGSKEDGFSTIPSWPWFVF